MVVGASGLTIEESERKVEELETDEEIEEQVGSCLELLRKREFLKEKSLPKSFCEKSENRFFDPNFLSKTKHDRVLKCHLGCVFSISNVISTISHTLTSIFDKSIIFVIFTDFGPKCV